MNPLLGTIYCARRTANRHHGGFRAKSGGRQGEVCEDLQSGAATAGTPAEDDADMLNIAVPDGCLYRSVWMCSKTTAGHGLGFLSPEVSQKIIAEKALHYIHTHALEPIEAWGLSQNKYGVPSKLAVHHSSVHSAFQKHEARSANSTQTEKLVNGMVSHDDEQLSWCQNADHIFESEQQYFGHNQTGTLSAHKMRCDRSLHTPMLGSLPSPLTNPTPGLDPAQT